MEFRLGSNSVLESVLRNVLYGVLKCVIEARRKIVISIV